MKSPWFVCSVAAITVLASTGCQTKQDRERLAEIGAIIKATETPEAQRLAEERWRQHDEWKKKYMDPQGRSENLDEDIKVMWSVAPKKGNRDWCAATLDAIPASDRVFNTVNLVGLTKEEVASKLHFEMRAADYGYYAPFWPVKKGVQVVRIDNGNFGWQFNLIYGPNGRLVRVERQWIH